MSTFVESRSTTFHVVSCYHCSNLFAINADLYRRACIEAYGLIYCPACGKTSGWHESADQKKIKELERKLKWEAENSERQRNMRISVENTLRATKGQITKLKNRVANGVCPCCKRTFQNLARHMKAMHPEEVNPSAQEKEEGKKEILK